MRDYEINSDLKQSKFENLKFVQGDTGSKIIVNLFEDSQTVNLTDCTVLAKYKRADGYTDNKSATVTEDNTITVEVDETMTATVGVLKLVFEITYETTKKVSTFMLLADITEGIGAKSTTGGGTGDIVVDVDLSNYYTKSEVNSLLNNIANELKLTGSGNTIKLMLGTRELSSLTISNGTVEPNPTTYNITNSLENATNSNTATSIEENTSYSASISANSGYKLKTITVTMSGIDITSNCYSNGTISIESVTGNIVITVTTEVDSDVVVGSIDSSNNISLTGLNTGTYTLKYEDDTGMLSNYDTIAEMEVV